MLADENDLVLNEWELSGIVTLIRPDAALDDRTKVRLAIDLVREPSLPFLTPEPGHAAGAFAAVAALGFLTHRRVKEASFRV